MRTIETCQHCSYRIPSDAAICPGCGRRHAVRVRPAAPERPVTAEDPGSTDAPVAAPRPGKHAWRRHGPLLRTARWTRWLLALTAWISTAFGVAALSRYVVGLDRVADDLTADDVQRVSDVTHVLGLVALGAFVLAVAGAVAWSRLAHRNLASLELTSSWTSAWSLGGWLIPGRRAKADKRTVDALWRDSSPVLVDLPRRGWSRRPVSRVVLHWWTLWLAVPAAALIAAVAAAGPDGLDDLLPLAGLAGAALAVAAARALYDVVGLVTVAQAHRAEAVVRDRAAAVPWTDDDDGWADDVPSADDGDESGDRGWAYNHFAGREAEPASSAASASATVDTTA